MFENLVLNIQKNTNQLGRDFVLGDIHGEYSLLMEALKAVDFKVETDRVFCVGDLIDRGPESLDCLRLLKEPWFFCTRGNHENMLLQFFQKSPSYYSTALDFIRNGGQWIYEVEKNPSTLSELTDELIPLLLKLPLRINVEHASGNFIVTHARYDLNQDPKKAVTDAQLKKEDEVFYEELIWDRVLVGQMSRDLTHLYGFDTKKILELSLSLNKMTPLDALNELHKPISVGPFDSDTRLKGKRIYVGHNSLPFSFAYKNHVFIDTACGKGTSTPKELRKSYAGVCLLDHSKVIINA